MHIRMLRKVIFCAFSLFEKSIFEIEVKPVSHCPPVSLRPSSILKSRLLGQLHFAATYFFIYTENLLHKQTRYQKKGRCKMHKYSPPFSHLAQISVNVRYSFVIYIENQGGKKKVVKKKDLNTHHCGYYCTKFNFVGVC